MLSREAVMMAVETLQSDDFYSAVNKALFEAMCALYAAGRPVDLVTMTDELNRRVQIHLSALPEPFGNPDERRHSL